MLNDRDTYFLEDRGLGIYDDLYAGHRAKTPIKKHKLREMDELFDEAERTLADDANRLRRVKIVRLSLQYAIVQYADKEDPIRGKAIKNAIAVARTAGIPDTDPFMKVLSESTHQ